MCLLSEVYLLQCLSTDDFLFRFEDTIRVLSNWDAHTSATEGEGRCERFKDCPFMRKMPCLVKISLGGVSGGNDNNDDIDKNNEFKDEDSNSDDNRGIDGVADLENQSNGINETENDVEHKPVMAHDEDESEVENASCMKYCCFF